MKFLDYIRFALKNIWRQKLRSILTIFAVIIGATSVVAMLSLVFGAKQAVLGQIEASGALTQITVVGNTDTKGQDLRGGNSGDVSGKKLDDTLAAQLATLPHVAAVTPIASAYAFNKVAIKGAENNAFKMDQVQAYVPSTAADKKLIGGRNLTLADKEGKIVLSNGLAGKLAPNPSDLVGKKVIIIMQKGYAGEGADIPQPPSQQQFTGSPTKAQQDAMQKVQQDYQQSQQDRITTLEATVVGVADAGFGDTSYISMDWARGINTYKNWQQDPVDMERYQKEQNSLNQNAKPGQQPIQPAPVKMILTGDDQIAKNGYSALYVKADDAIRKTYTVGAITAKETLATILNAFNIISLVLGIIGAISLLVAAIGVVNTMVMATLERTREIGVMRACGATRGAVRRLFTIEAALLGFWGGVFGVLVGIGLSTVANHFTSGRLPGVAAGTRIVSVPPWLALAVIAATTVIGMLAGMGPAFRASKMNPVEALRYE
jgi:ABC-type antimicrobial peptide transport system permease subunit